MPLALLRTGRSADPSADQSAPSIWRRYRRLWIALGIIVAGAVLYFGSEAFIAYTDDAYVRSDLVAIAPEVAGIVKTVRVIDNQSVAAGELLATIDPEPYQLDVDLKQQKISSLEAVVAVKEQAQAADAASVDAAEGELRYAQQEFDRTNALAREQFAAQAALDKAADELRKAKDRLASRQVQLQTDAREVAAAKTDVAVARAELAVAEYKLSRTRLVASVGGHINNLNLRPGVYARIGEPIIGIVDDSQWRVIANFKEDVAASVAPGKPVWVWLDSDPWHVRRGRVEGVGRGIARSNDPEQLLPYVAPTTDWIRLRRRFPVTILLDPPMPARGLLMGADARVFFVR
ncbi:MAG: HlyD family secretion protein [Alphaproteobacteria bacterium]